MVYDVPDLDLPALLPSRTTALRAERKSFQTVDSYMLGVTLIVRWCVERQVETRRQPTVRC